MLQTQGPGPGPGTGPGCGAVAGSSLVPPAAWERGRVWSWAVAGNTVSSAPESTRKDFREAWSQMVIVLGYWEPAVETSNGRRSRFPAPVDPLHEGGVLRECPSWGIGLRGK